MSIVLQFVDHSELRARCIVADKPHTSWGSTTNIHFWEICWYSRLLLMFIHQIIIVCILMNVFCDNFIFHNPSALSPRFEELMINLLLNYVRCSLSVTVNLFNRILFNNPDNMLSIQLLSEIIAVNIKLYIIK